MAGGTGGILRAVPTSHGAAMIAPGEVDDIDRAAPLPSLLAGRPTGLFRLGTGP